MPVYVSITQFLLWLAGSRRLKRKLSEQGFQVSRRRIIRLMKKAGLYCKTRKKFRATTDSSHNKPIADNLLDRQFNVTEPDRYFVGDITYIATDEGWLYLAVVIDLFSRMVIGWSMDKSKHPIIPPTPTP